MAMRQDCNGISIPATDSRAEVSIISRHPRLTIQEKDLMKKLVLIPVALLAIATIASAQMQMSQDKSKRPSPPASAECKFSDGKTVKIDYSSPRAKGRKIFGGLVPYGEVWRTGANEATTFVT